jgi:hypothetical protein
MCNKGNVVVGAIATGYIKDKYCYYPYPPYLISYVRTCVHTAHHRMIFLSPLNLTLWLVVKCENDRNSHKTNHKTTALGTKNTHSRYVRPLSNVIQSPIYGSSICVYCTPVCVIQPYMSNSQSCLFIGPSCLMHSHTDLLSSPI